MKNNKIDSYIRILDKIRILSYDLNQNVSSNIFVRLRVILGLYTVEIENYGKKGQ